MDHHHRHQPDNPRDRGDDNQPQPNDNQGHDDPQLREDYRQGQARSDIEDNHVRSEPNTDADPGRENQGNYAQQPSPDVQQESQKENLVDIRNESAPQSSSSSESSGE